MDGRIRARVFLRLRQQRPHMRLGALVVYLLAALTQLSGYQEGGSTILQGQWFTTLLTLFGGAAIYLQWHLYRRKGSAQWEQTLQDAALCAALFYTSILPLLFFAERGSIIVFLCFGSSLGVLPRQRQVGRVQHIRLGQCNLYPALPSLD